MPASKSSAGWLLGVAFVLIAAGAFWFLGSSKEEPIDHAGLVAEANSQDLAPLAEPTKETSGKQETKSNPSTAGLDVQAPAPSVDTDERIEVAARHKGLVTDEVGAPLAGALVSWTPASFAVPGAISNPHTFQEWSAVSLTATTDASGHFAFEGEVPEAEGALWASLPGFVPEGRMLASHKDSVQADWSLAMKPDAAWKLSVVDAEGHGVAGATVVSKDYRGPAYHDIRAPEFYTLIQLFMRSFVMDADGRGTVSTPVGGSLQAFAEDGASARVITGAEHELELVIEDLLEVSGDVASFEGLGPAFVSVARVHESGSTEALTVLSVLPSGELEEAGLPRIRTGGYRFQLEGMNVVPEAQAFAADELGTKLALHFAAKPAKRLDVHVTDSVTHLDVGGATVYSSWPSEDGTRLQYSTGASKTDDAGRATIPLYGGPWPQAFVRKDGYLAQSFGPFNVDALGEGSDAEGNAPVELELRPIGRVHGVVLLDGKPVPDFIVAYYEGSGYGVWDEVAATNQTDGSFTIEGVGAGELNLIAMRHGFAQSPATAIQVEPGATTEVELAIAAGGIGRGRVLDAETMQGIPGAEVMRALTSATQFIGPDTASVITTAADGSYELHGLAQPRERVIAYADGYVQGELSASPAKDGDYDLGTILMAPSKTLLLQVLCPESVNPHDVSYSVDRTFFAGPGLFDTDGMAAIGGAKPGIVGISLGLPGDVYVDFDRTLQGAGPWEISLDLRGSGAVRVFAPDFDKAFLEEEAWVALSRLDDKTRGRCAHRQLVPAGGAAGDGVSIGGLVPGEYAVALKDGDFALLASTTLTVAQGETSVTLKSTGERRAVRVVTSDGQPLVGALVWVKGPGLGGFVDYAETGADGVAHLGSLPGGPATLNVNGGKDRKLDFEISALGTPDDPTEIVFEAEGILDLVITDRGFPLEGILVYVDSAVTAAPLPWRTVGPGGALRFEGISEIDYNLRPSASSIWYEEKLAHASAAGQQQAVEFRRIGDLEVSVLDKNGQPAPGVPVTITSLEYETDVAEWLAAGRAGSTTGLVTGPDGIVRVDGLPNGPYRAQVGSSSTDGEVPALGTGTLAVHLID